MKLAVIVQARFGSSRLPGKVLEKLGDKSALLRCLDRCAAIPGVDEIVCAVPDVAKDDVVAAEARAGGYRATRGPEGDVLARYAAAATEVGADLVMRVTSDCPLIDPEICGRVRDLFVSRGVDYACNNLPPTWPHGMDCEIFAAQTLFRAAREADDPYAREHVTPWMRRHAALKKANLIGPAGGTERLRWTLDFTEDLGFVRAVFDIMGSRAASAGWAELAALCWTRPELAAINASRVDEARLAPPAMRAAG